MMDKLTIDALISKYAPQEQQEYGEIADEPQIQESQPEGQKIEDYLDSISQYLQQSQSFKSEQPKMRSTSINITLSQRKQVTPKPKKRKKQRNVQTQCKINEFVNPYDTNTEVGRKQQKLTESLMNGMQKGQYNQQLQSMGMKSMKVLGPNKCKKQMQRILQYLMEGKMPPQYLQKLDKLIKQ